jgi:hypothetical protein
MCRTFVPAETPQLTFGFRISKEKIFSIYGMIQKRILPT